MPDARLGAINLNLLIALDALLTECNVTRAAARAGVTQSAMSHSLQKLREIFDDPLLVRGPNGMTATERARELAEPIRRGLAELSRALVSGSSFDPASASRAFTIGMGDYFATLLLPPLLGFFGREAPGVDINVRPTDGARTAVLLEAGELDMAVVVTIEGRGSLRARRLFTETFVCLVREGHPDVGDTMPLDTFVRLPHALISPSGGGPAFVDEALARLGRSRRVAVRVPYFLAAPLLVARSDLVLTAPRRIAEQFARRLPLKVLPAPLELPSFSVQLVWHERADADAAHSWLRGAIARAAAAMDDEDGAFTVAPAPRISGGSGGPAAPAPTAGARVRPTR